MFLLPGFADPPSGLQAGLFPSAFRTHANARAAPDEPEGGVGGGGGANAAQSAGWPRGRLQRRGHR